MHRSIENDGGQKIPQSAANAECFTSHLVNDAVDCSKCIKKFRATTRVDEVIDRPCLSADDLLTFARYAKSRSNVTQNAREITSMPSNRYPIGKLFTVVVNINKRALSIGAGLCNH